MTDTVQALQNQLQTVPDAEKVSILIQLAEAVHLSDAAQTIAYAEQALDLAETHSSDIEKGRCLNVLGIGYQARGHYSRAESLYKEAQQLFEAAGDRKWLARNMCNLGAVCMQIGDYDRALPFLLKSVDLADQENCIETSGRATRNIGNIFFYRKDYDLALDYHLKSLAMYESIDDQRGIEAELINIGNVYSGRGDHDTAIAYYIKALDLSHQLNILKDVAINHYNIGDSLVQMNEYETGLDHFQQSLQAAQEYGNTDLQALNYIDMGKVFTKLTRYDEAATYLHKGLELSQQANSKRQLRDAHSNLADMYEQTDQFEQALHHYKAYVNVLNDLFSEEKTRAITEMQVKYESDKKTRDAEIHRLKHVELAKAYHQLEVDNNRKTHELEEAREMQLAMLPDHLPQFPGLKMAVYMQTAQEVGGDYYDYILSADGAITLAIGDATGHGLKAGTMVALTKGYFQTLADHLPNKDVLFRISRRIKHTNFGNMYMGLTLLTYFEHTVSVVPAGMPPFFHYHRQSGQVDTLSLRGPMLGFVPEFAYETYECALQPGDTLLFMSDGLWELMNAWYEPLGEERIQSCLQIHGHCSPRDIIDRMLELAESWTDRQPPQDDVTLMVLQHERPTRDGDT